MKIKQTCSHKSFNTFDHTTLNTCKICDFKIKLTETKKEWKSDSTQWLVFYSRIIQKFLGEKRMIKKLKQKVD